MKNVNIKGVLTLVTCGFCLSFLSSCLDSEDQFDTADQLAIEQDLIDQYINENGIDAEIDTSGAELRYVVNAEGTGDYPKRSEVSLVDFKGTVLGGTTFLEDDSIYIRLNTWVYGYYLLLPYVREGGEMTMFIPSYYGYGQQTAFDGKVPTNGTLMVEVKLQETMSNFEYEQRGIDAYLEDNDLMDDVQIDTVENLRFIIENEGTGDFPTASDLVNVDYQGMFLNGETFDSGISANLSLSSLINGWKVLMPNVREGGTIKMFIPSDFAYGAEGSGAIPGYTSLVFTVTLNSIE